MPLPQKSHDEISIVLVGSFNPRIFHPSWFSKYDLLKKVESTAAEIKLINNDFSLFTIEWLNVAIERGRFQFTSTKEPYYEALRDLVISTFTILEHTPVTSFGINRHITYLMDSEEKWHDLGFKLVPKENWADSLNYIGMKNLMVQGKRPDEYKGSVQVSVHPHESEKRSVVLSVNDHFDLSSDPKGAKKFLEIIQSEWSNSLSRAIKIIEKTVSLAEPAS